MSEISDEIKAAFNRLGHDIRHQVEEQKGDILNDRAILAPIDGSAIAENHQVLSWEAMHSHYRDVIARDLRWIYRRMSGCDPFENGVDAINRSLPVGRDRVSRILRDAFGDGIQMSHAVSPVVRKHIFYHKTDELFTNEKFRNESELLMFNLMLDEDVAEIMNTYFDHALKGLSVLSGFSMFSKQMANQKIWDIWLMAMNSVYPTMYLSGWTLGTEWKDKDTLKGILSVTEANGD